MGDFISHEHTTVCDNIHFLLRGNFCQAASPQNPSSRERSEFSKSYDSTEYKAIQEDSVRYYVATVSFGTLLFAVHSSGTISVSKNSIESIIRFSFLYIGEFDNSNVFQFIVKPSRLLLEDQRSETSIERHIETIVLFKVSVELRMIWSIFQFNSG